MAEIKYLSLAGLTSLWGKIKNLVQTGDTAVKTEVMREVAKKVDKVEGKSLIDDTLITKLEGVEAGAQVNKIEVVKLDGVALEISADKSVDVAIAGTYAKKTDFEALKGSISSAYVFKGSKKTKEELDGVATEDLRVGDVYNVEADGMNYAWTGTAWDALGGITDLSEYMKTADLVAITDEEINTICK